MRLSTGDTPQKKMQSDNLEKDETKWNKFENSLNFHLSFTSNTKTIAINVLGGTRLMEIVRGHLKIEYG